MGKVLLITGASSGIGAATARAAVLAGWRVVLVARSADKLETLAASLSEEIPHRDASDTAEKTSRESAVLTLTVDVTDPAAQDRMVADALSHFGQIDALFANAGTGGQSGGFSGAPVEAWQRLVNVNILGVAYSLRSTLAELKRSRGHVLLTGSVAGRRTLAGSMYSASKWAVSAIGYGLREELKGTGVRVTLIEPGMVDTPFFNEAKPQALQPQDVAASVMYALSQPPSVDVHELMILPTPPLDA